MRIKIRIRIQTALVNPEEKSDQWTRRDMVHPVSHSGLPHGPTAVLLLRGIPLTDRLLVLFHFACFSSINRTFFGCDLFYFMLVLRGTIYDESGQSSHNSA